MILILGILVYLLGSFACSWILGRMGEPIDNGGMVLVCFLWPIMVPIIGAIVLFDKINTHGLSIYQKNSSSSKEDQAQNGSNTGS